MRNCFHKTFVAAVFHAFIGVVAVYAQNVGPSAPIILEHADSGTRRTENGQEVIELNGNVQGHQGVVAIKADRAVLYTASNNAILTGNVVVNQPGMVMTAPRADYDGNSRIATAPDGMTLKEDNATLTAGSGSYRMYERIAYFNSGVTLQDDQGTLRAGSGEYYSIERKAVFRDNVTVVSDSGTINARNLTYWRDTEETYATGNVVLRPKKYGAILSGDTLRNIPARNYTLALGSPKLVQIDSVATNDSLGTVRLDTTTITALKMEAFRSGREEYRATDSVHLTRGDLMAVARLARYYPSDDIIALGGGKGIGATDTAKPVRDTARAVTGSLDTATASEPPLRGVPPEMYPIVWYGDSQLTGDTITVALDQRRLRAIDVLGNAFAVTTKEGLPQRFDQLAGNRLYFDVLLDTIRFVRSEGMASSIYFLVDGTEPSGVNRTSADTIHIGFDEGKVSRITFFGHRTRSEGEYFPEQLVAGRETTYRLEGFRWIPREVASGNVPAASAPATKETKQAEDMRSSIP